MDRDNWSSACNDHYSCIEIDKGECCVYDTVPASFFSDDFD